MRAIISRRYWSRRLIQQLQAHDDSDDDDDACLTALLLLSSSSSSSSSSTESTALIDVSLNSAGVTCAIRRYCCSKTLSIQDFWRPSAKFRKHRQLIMTHPQSDTHAPLEATRLLTLKADEQSLTLSAVYLPCRQRDICIAVTTRRPAAAAATAASFYCCCCCWCWLSDTVGATGRLVWADTDMYTPGSCNSIHGVWGNSNSTQPLHWFLCPTISWGDICCLPPGFPYHAIPAFMQILLNYNQFIDFSRNLLLLGSMRIHVLRNSVLRLA